MTQKADRWVAIGLDHQVQPGSSNPVMVDGFALAMWRPDGGPVNVWEDRCPHRGMRLSYGFVRGNVLRCIYHGWGYGSGGQCVSIPAHPDLTPPKTICANVFRSETRYGLVWTNLAETPLAALPDSGDGVEWTPVRSLYVNRPESTVRDGIVAVEEGNGSSVEADESTVTVRCAGGTVLLMAIQKVDENKTALHVVARGQGTSTSRERLALVERMELLRGQLETC